LIEDTKYPNNEGGHYIMTENAAGLSFDEAFAEAVEETGFEEPVEETPSSVTPPPAEVSQEEQPAVESDEGVNLFADSESTKAEEDQGESQSYEVTVRGQTSLVTIDELIAGYQRQEDYTRGTQEVAELKTEHNNAITLWEALEEDYAGTVQRLMARTGIKGDIAPKPEQDILWRSGKDLRSSRSF
jgi:hypothetical protein